LPCCRSASPRRLSPRPAAAASAAPAPAASTPAAPHDDGGLTGSVSDDNAWQDLGIAIPSFATDRRCRLGQAGSTAALGRAWPGHHGDLKNNGLFKPIGPDALPASVRRSDPPDFPGWRARGGRNAGAGQRAGRPDGR
jgi:TolB protein